jgi:hypothetical protein
VRRIVVLVVMTRAAFAMAAPPTSDADREFERGRTLLEAGKYAEACAAFDASEKLDPQIATELNQADCREKNGQLATAWALFGDVATRTRGASDARGKKLHKVALDHRKKIEPRLSTLEVRVAQPVDGLELRRGDAPIAAGAALPIDGGSYTIVARAPGRREWSQTVRVGDAGDRVVVDVPVLVAEPVAAPPPTLRAKAEPHDAARDGHAIATTSTTAAPHRARIAPWLALGGSVVLLGGALGVDLVAQSTFHQAVAEVDPTKQDALWRSANLERHVAQGIAVAGAATAGVAVWMWLRKKPSDSARPPRIVVEPAGVAGVQLRGAW